MAVLQSKSVKKSLVLAAVLALSLMICAETVEGARIAAAAFDGPGDERSTFTPTDTAYSTIPQSTLRLKAMIDRETGEPLIEGTRWKRRKDPKVALLCALTIPGLGQIYNEKPLKALIAGGMEIFYLSRILHYYRMEKREEKVRDLFPRYITEEGPDGPVTYQNPQWTSHDWYVQEYKERQIDWVWWSAGCILVVALDAYIDAYLHDMDFHIEGSPVEDSAGLSLVIDF